MLFYIWTNILIKEKKRKKGSFSDSKMIFSCEHSYLKMIQLFYLFCFKEKKKINRESLLIRIKAECVFLNIFRKVEQMVKKGKDG